MQCPGCGAIASAGSHYCGTCGASLDQAAAPNPPVPKDLMRRMLEARAAVEGERKQVTILFADIKGSTALIDGLDPEQAEAILHPPLLAMIDAVHRYEGTVNRVQGDGIMALFGAPLAHEDNAVRAAFAGLEMVAAVGRLRDDRIAIRVGLNAGEVVVRSLNNDLSVDYDAVGASVVLAARMERLAPPGTILCTGEVVRQAGGLVRAEPRGRLPVEGIGQPVETWEIVGAAPARTRWEVSTTRGLSRFAGRDAELARLPAVLADLAPACEWVAVGRGYLGWWPFHDDQAPDERGRPGRPSFYVVHDRFYGWSWRCFSTNCQQSLGPLRHTFRLFQLLLDVSSSAKFVTL